MYLIVDMYGVVYKANNINTVLKGMAESGDITIIEIQGCDSPKVFDNGKWLDIKLQEN